MPLEPEVVIVNEGSCHLTDYENPTEAIWSMSSSSMSSDCSENDPLSRYLGSQRRHRRQRRPRRHLPPQPSREADSPSPDPAEQDRFI